MWFTTEFGIALVVPAVLIAAWCWNKGAEVEPARMPADSTRYFDRPLKECQ